MVRKVVADPTQSQLQTLSAASFLVAFVVHASVADAWIRLTRKRRVRGASGSRLRSDTGQQMMPTAKEWR